jgi:hypothetical protein
VAFCEAIAAVWRSTPRIGNDQEDAESGGAGHREQGARLISSADSPSRKLIAMVTRPELVSIKSRKSCDAARPLLIDPMQDSAAPTLC